VQISTIDDKIMGKTGSGNLIYWLIAKENGAKNFEMRYIKIPAGGKSSSGQHPHEHEVFIVKGEGTIKGKNGEKKLVPGLAVFVEGNEEHQWINRSKRKTLEFICVVPAGAEPETKPS
jgi:quercetin dioxygenase-like cupin family protein